METLRIGILMTDRIFARALAAGLARECRSMAFQILDSAEAGQELDMVLTSVSENGPEGERVVRLVRDPEEACITGPPPYGVYRYQESQNMVRELIQIYFELTGRMIPYREKRRCRLISFVAGGGGWGTTSTAISVCRMLQRIYGSRCLYLNLCPVDDSKKYLKQEGSADLMKLLYYLQQDRSFPLDGFITATEELDYVNTRLLNCACDEMDGALLARFLKKAEETGAYDFVAADMGSHLTRRNRRLAEQSDIVVELIRSDLLKQGKYFSDIAREIENLADHGRLIRVETFSENWREEQEDDVLAVSADWKVFREEEQYLVPELSQNYGLEIGAIAKRIMEEEDYGAGKAELAG